MELNSQVNALYLINLHKTLDWPWHKRVFLTCPWCLWNLKFWCWWPRVLAVSRSLMSTKTWNLIHVLINDWKSQWFDISPKWYIPIKGTWCSLLTLEKYDSCSSFKYCLVSFWKNINFLEQTQIKLVYDVERVRLYKLWLRSWTIKQTNRSQNFQVSNRINWKCWGIKSK